MELKIITGMSGAGKSQILRMLEDLNYYAVDHLPVELLVDFIHTLSSEDRQVSKAAIAVDIRENGHFHTFFKNLEALKPERVNTEIIFLEAETDVLMQRFRETRRRHPLGNHMRILDAIEEEKILMAPIREIADRRIDTSHINVPAMQEYVRHLFGESSGSSIMVNVVSFGFKYGIPQDADFIFDMRFLPNPYYDQGLKALTGLDKAVGDFLRDAPATGEFLVRVKELLLFMLANFESRARDNLVIAVGCTGGQHRSVFFAQEIGNILADAEYCVT
ncbi:MAG: RNase adapter RapZ, partial [Bacillota bacterium]|nr:RNase adapter RapZ [Bacillota bacterium]